MVVCEDSDAALFRDSEPCPMDWPCEVSRAENVCMGIWPPACSGGRTVKEFLFTSRLV